MASYSGQVFLSDIQLLSFASIGYLYLTSSAADKKDTDSQE